MNQNIKLVSSARIWVVGMVCLALTAFLFQSGTVEAGLRSTPPEGFSFDFGRWPYPLHAEVNARLQELARKYPKLTRTHVIGKTRSGRELMVIEITNRDTGPGESKPALWMDGNMHMGEETGRIYLAYFIERLLFEYGKNSDATRLVDTRTFYVLPVFDADGGERMLTRHPAWPGYKAEEHAGRDMDGDGYITRMRVKDDSRGRGYRSYIEGPDIASPDGNPLVTERRQRNELTGEREDTDFNRNWSAEWEPQEGGSGPYPFSLPEVRAVADFITSHRNIFFAYNIHSGGGARSYMVRPPMNHPDDFMPLEDNDFYVRIGAIWSALSEGGIMQTNYMSWNFNSRRPDPSELHGEGTIVNDRWRITGFSNDWCYMHAGIHSISPEVEGSAPDYNDDGFIRPDEIDRWHREEKGGQFFSPWTPYDHPVLGEVEIGGSRGIPAALDDTARMHSEWQYDLLRHIADRSPLLRIKDLTSEPIGGGVYRVVATLQNTGFLATYVTQNAIKIRRDYPANARIQVTGGEVVEGEPTQNAGHLPGRLTVISEWGHGEEMPTTAVEWSVEATGSEPLEVSVEAWAPKAGRDQKTITIEKSSGDENPFTKQVEVFGLHVYATADTPDDKVLHAANVLAQYLDNDEDGIPDNQAVLDAMVSRKAAMSMRKGEFDYADDWHRLRERYLPQGTRAQLLWGDETTLDAVDEQGKVLKIDVSWEEILHLVHVNGYAVVYPETFGMMPGTKIADAMDLARGGFFEEVPEQYPEDAWLAYYDESCGYGCQIAEYFHWALSSVLGAQDFPGRLEDVGDNWKLTTREKVKEQDPAVYALVTDRQFKLPTVIPDGSYSKQTFTIQEYP